MRAVRIFLLTLFSTPLLNPLATTNHACLNTTAGNHLNKYARTPRGGALDMGANRH